jgi:RNA polymerase sigma factor (sigma-70 family)
VSPRFEALPTSAQPVHEARSLGDEERAFGLAKRAAAGDLPATQEFLADIWPTLLRVTSGVLGAAHPDLGDASQQAMIALVRALPGFRGECHPAGYAARIALRVALRVRRNRKRDLTQREVFARLSESDTATASPEEDALATRRRELLCNLLQDLPEEQADALTLRVVMGWTLDEVSRATGAPVNTVRSRVRLAKEALRQRIESAPELCELSVKP